MKKIYLFLFLLLCIPFCVSAEELIPNADSGILIEASTGKIIYEKEKDKEVAIASMTKMVSQILIFEAIESGKISTSDIVTVSRNAADMGGSQIYLSEGENISVDDLIKGISIASGNDATVAMAEYIAGSEEKFVSMMNQKVKDMGLKHTHFVNCTGLDEEGHYSSAYDMGMIARELIVKHPDILKYSSIYEDYLREDTENRFWLVNTNKLIRFYEGADGLKTGHTDAAGYCLAATAVRNDIRMIGIVLGEADSKVRNKETMDFLDYGFLNTHRKILKKTGSVVKKIKMDKADHEIIQIVVKNPLQVILDSNEDVEYRYEYDIADLELPIKRGDVVGKVHAYWKNQEVSNSDLTVLENISKKSFLSIYSQTLLDMITGTY
ncbi:MAG: D-alanyl-D-alanine carboxypeptidase [Bacilli bacterium]|nr:D-alanyl-D-alanine carboxypeptidase [Bacilli bacterium]